MKQISVDQDVFDFLASKANAPGEPPAAVLRRELRVPLPQKTLDIDDDTYAFIAAKTAVVGESVSDILRRELRLAGGAPSHFAQRPPSPVPSQHPPRRRSSSTFRVERDVGPGTMDQAGSSRRSETYFESSTTTR